MSDERPEDEVPEEIAGDPNATLVDKPKRRRKKADDAPPPEPAPELPVVEPVVEPPAMIALAATPDLEAPSEPVMEEPVPNALVTLSADAGDAEPPIEDDALAAPHGSNPLGTLWGALTFQESAYAKTIQSENPVRTGLTVLAVVLLVVTLGSVIGSLFDLATSPRLGRVQEIVYSELVQMPWYAELRRDGGQAFVTQFEQIYELGWQIIPAISGAPSFQNLFATLCLTPIGGLISWGIIGLATLLLAKLFGGQANPAQHFGAVALSMSPMLFNAANLLPGLVVPGGLVSYWSLATLYVAVKVTHGLPWQKSLGVVLAFIVLGWLLNILLIVLAAIGFSVAGPALVGGLQ